MAALVPRGEQESNPSESVNQVPDAIDVFLCHTGANKEWARNLATRLEEEIIDVFFDQWDIAPGENILARIEWG